MTKTRLSFSRAHQYGDCGHRYKLSRIDGVPEIPSLALIGGGAFHDWAHDYEVTRLSRAFNVDPFEVYLEMHLDKTEQESGLDRSMFKASGKVSKAHPNKEDITVWRDELGPQMCETFKGFDWGDWKIATDLPPDSTGNTIGLEYHIEVPGFQGFVDRIEVDRLGNLRVVDYKAGQRVYPSIQLQLYMVAGQKMGLRTTYGGYYNARKGELTVKPVRWNHITFDQYLALSRMGIDSEFYLPNPGEHCGWCSVSAACDFRADA